MSVSASSQNGRILRVLADGKWKTVAAIHRRAGTSRLNSRISELRIKHGYTIEHEKVPGKQGSLGHRYRLIAGPPIPRAEAYDSLDSRLVVPGDSHAPRDLFNRYRLYRMKYDALELVATAASAEDVGVALVTLGAEGEFFGTCVGILDTHGNEEDGTWVLNPFEAVPA